jgi:hypothetical protein
MEMIHDELTLITAKLHFEVDVQSPTNYVENWRRKMARDNSILQETWIQNCRGV